MKLFKVLMVPAVVAAMGLTACTGGSSSSSSSSSSSGGGGACGTRPANHADISSSTGTKAAADAVAVALTSGTATMGAFCGTTADAHDYWWKLAGAHAMGANFRLQVTFNNGANAEDIDFEVVYFDADGMGYTNITSCSAVSGVNEDCMDTLDAATTDVYVKTTTSSSTKAEGFSITLTKS